jgi:hypothetical protein
MRKERLEARTDQGYQAIWRVGQGRCSVGTEREKSDLRQQQHIISCRNGTTRTATARRWTENGRVGRPPGRQSSYRAREGIWGGSERETGSRGCALDHLPGHTITLRRGPPHAPSLGVGIGRLPLGDWAGAAGSQGVANCEPGPESARRRRLRPGPSGGASEVFGSVQRGSSLLRCRRCRLSGNRNAVLLDVPRVTT